MHNHRFAACLIPVSVLSLSSSRKPYSRNRHTSCISKSSNTNPSLLHCSTGTLYTPPLTFFQLEKFIATLPILVAPFSFSDKNSIPFSLTPHYSHLILPDASLLASRPHSYIFSTNSMGVSKACVLRQELRRRKMGISEVYVLRPPIAEEEKDGSFRGLYTFPMHGLTKEYHREKQSSVLEK